MANLLFINHIITGDLVSLRWWMLAIAIMALLVIIASLFDLYWGIAASKAAGIFETTSYGLRKTVDKDKGYLTLYAFGVFIDSCLSFFCPIPVSCAVVAIGEIIIEGVSVVENSKRAKINDCTNPLDVAKAVIKTFGISDAKKIEEIITYIKEQKKEKV